MKLMKKFLADFLVPVLIFGLNLILVWPLFQGGYTQHLGSIESVFIADARFILNNFPHLIWNPEWYTGFPFHLFYTPLLPFLVALAHGLYSVISLASWYRIIIGLFYALSPVSLYFLVRFLTGQSLVGLLAALLYSFAPTLGYLLAPVANLAADYQYGPWRLITLILFGESGHVMTMAFLPLALLFFIKAVRERGRKNLLLASFWAALTALTNLIGLMALVVMMAVVFLVELLGGEGRQKLGRLLVAFLFSFGLVAFWFNLSFIKASFSIGAGGTEGGMNEVYLHLLPFFFLLVPVLWLLASLGKKLVLRPILIALGWMAIFFAAAFFWFRNQTMFLPQPNRYLIEMDMGTALFFSWLLFLAVKKIFASKWAWLGKFFYIVVCLSILYLPLRYTQPIWSLLQPHRQIETSSEYQVADWLEKNTHGERIYASGTTAFWLNVFTDLPQIRGGNDGVPNPWILHAVYQVNTSENVSPEKRGKVAGWWLRVLNAVYLVVNLPHSGEIYHDFKFPEKFDQIEGMEKLVDLNGDVIYQVPLNQPSLAQVVNKGDFANLEVLKNAVDVKNLQRYVEYIDPSSLNLPAGEAGLRRGTAEFSWVEQGMAKITADLDEGEGIAVQISHYPGWKAYVEAGKKRIPLRVDPIGFIFLDPQVSGPVEVDLVYTLPWDVWFGYFLTACTLGAIIAYSRLEFLTAKLFGRIRKNWEADEAV